MKHPGNHTLTQTELNKVLEMHRLHIPVSKISEKTGFTPSWIRQMISGESKK